MTEEHQAEITRLAAVHAREMDEVCQQAIDAQNASNTTKEQLEEDLAEARRMLVDSDAAITECIGRLHTRVLGEHPCISCQPAYRARPCLVLSSYLCVVGCRAVSGVYSGGRGSRRCVPAGTHPGRRHERARHPIV